MPEENNLNIGSADVFVEEDISARPISWKTHGGFKLLYIIWRFFTPPRKTQHEINLLRQVEVLINSYDDIKEILDPCERLITLHRIVENTRARRRLERWITRTIIGYLLVVGILLIIDALGVISLPNAVMITLLSTTTVNIVALGLILVRGLFHEKEKDDVNKEKPLE